MVPKSHVKQTSPITASKQTRALVTADVLD